MCTTANYIKEVCTKITSRSANKNFISIQSILLTKKKKNESHDIARIFSIFFVQHHTHVVIK